MWDKHLEGVYRGTVPSARLRRSGVTELNRCVSGEELNNYEYNIINAVSLQADDPGGLLHVSGGDDRLRCHPQPGAPLGGLHHRWSSGVNQSPPSHALVLVPPVAGSLLSEHQFEEILCFLHSDVCVCVFPLSSHMHSHTVRIGILHTL